MHNNSWSANNARGDLKGGGKSIVVKIVLTLLSETPVHA
jgi:hypothetical protein